MRMRALIVVAAALSAVVAGGAAAATFEIVGPAREIPPYFHGVADPILHQLGRQSNWFEPEKVKAYKDLGIQNLRGPGGSIGNYYLWRQGVLINSLNPLWAKYYGKDRRNPLTDAKTVSANAPPLTVADIYRMSEAADVPHVFMVNVCSQEAQDIVDLIKEIHKHTQRPIHLELGNELYAADQGAPFKSAKDYIDKMTRIYLAVKAFDPAVKIGIVAAGKTLEDSVSAERRQKAFANNDWESSPADRLAVWNPALARHPECYDAVIVHQYCRLKTAEYDTPAKLMRFFLAWDQWNDDGLAVQVAQFPGKEFWVTEWNTMPISPKNAYTPEDAIYYNDSPGIAVQLMDRELRLVASGHVYLSCLHSFSGGGFGLVRKSEDGNGYQPLPNYHFFKALGALLAGHPQYYPVSSRDVAVRDERWNFLGPKKPIRLADVGAWGFGDGKEMTTVVFINRTEKPRTVSIAGRRLALAWVYSAANPFPDAPVRGKEKGSPKHNPTPVTPATPAAASLELAPFTAVIARASHRSS